MTRSAFPSIVALCVTAALAAQAQAADYSQLDVAKGFYIGGALTQSRFDDDNFSFDDIDDEDNSWKAIAGFRFHENFALEGNYVDFGAATAPSLPTIGGFRAEAKAYSIFVVGLIPLPYVDLFAKAGIAQIDAEGAGRAVLFEDDSTEFAYGAGAQMRFGPLAFRAEYEKYDTDVVGDLDLISLGATYTFGPRD